MRKMFLGISLILFGILLAGCSAEKEITGEIIEVRIDEASGIEEYVVLTEKGDTVGLTATNGTALFSWVDGLDVEAIQSGEQSGAIVSAQCGRTKTTIVTKDGNEIKAYPATNIVVIEAVTRDAYILSDGTALTRRDTTFDRFSYELPDGTEILWGEVPHPANSLSGEALEDRADLSEKAKEAISAYLGEYGVSYNLDESLENACVDYLNAEETGRDFRSNIMLQENRLLEGNGHYVTCSISLSKPAEQYYTGVAVEDKRFVIFDTQTGESVPLWELFNVSEQQARITLGEHCVADDMSITAEEYANAIVAENVCWSPQGVEIYFPVGCLQEYEHTLIVNVDVADIETILSEKAR